MNSRANESSPNQPTPRLAAVMPICVTARYSVTPVDDEDRTLGGRLPLAGQLFQARPAHADDGELRGDEHAVDHDEREDREDREQELMTIGIAGS